MHSKIINLIKYMEIQNIYVGRAHKKKKSLHLFNKNANIEKIVCLKYV